MNKLQICSVAPEEFRIARPTFNCFVTIPKAKPDSYSSTWVTDHEDVKRFYQDLKTIEYVPFAVTAQEIVSDLFKSEQLQEKGCFVPKGDVPTEEEIGDARGKRMEYLLRCVMEGDRLYSQFGERGIQYIPDYFKRASVEAGANRPWVFSVMAKTSECPACGEALKLLASGLPPAICRSCHSVLDPERAAQYQRISESRQPEVPAKRKYTRKAKSEEVAA